MPPPLQPDEDAGPAALASAADAPDVSPRAGARLGADASGPARPPTTAEERDRRPPAAERGAPSSRSRALWAATLASEAAFDAAPLSEREARKVRRTKRADRPELAWPAGWSRQRHAQRWAATKARLEDEARRAEHGEGGLGADAPRVHASELTLAAFRERFERPRLPCVVEGLADEWPARERWGLAELAASAPGVKLKCGEDDDEKSLKLKLRAFLRYQASEARADDSPLYVFDSAYDRTAKLWLADYAVPSLFPEDLFALVGEARRPPNRWFLVGPERSGTTLHTDPLETSAWNTLVRGRKLWVCFAPNAPRALVKGRGFLRPGGDDEAVDWFAELLPRIVADAEFPRETPYYRFVQRPGETVFVPHGWWHAVLNLDDTVAVTQNYVGSVNFAHSWRATRVERRKMARKWRSLLQRERPDLYAECVAADAADGFDLDEHIERKREERRRRRREREARRGGGRGGGRGSRDGEAS